MHIPYHHKDLLDFLKAIKRKFKPDRVICIGDEIDAHSFSMHQADPSLFSPGDEMKHAIHELEKIYEIFPEVDVVESNHGSMAFRKQKASGLPVHLFRSYSEILEAPNKWKWHKDLTIQLPNGEYCYFHHGKSAKLLSLSQSVGMSAVCGHFHESFCITHWAGPKALYFEMRVGCLIDNESLAFAYNKNNTKKPIIGCGIIIDGQPKLIPMVLDKVGRWVRKIV